MQKDDVHAMQSSTLRKQSALFDLDKQWSKEPNFVLYDFNNPEDIPANIHHTFDCVVIDPPFITEEVWTLYAAATRLLLAPEGQRHLLKTCKRIFACKCACRASMSMMHCMTILCLSNCCPSCQLVLST